MVAQRIPVTIDRGSPIPLYHQLAEQLTKAITDGDLQPGDPLENEVAFVDRLKLSRPTVRRAIHELVDQGLLVRRRGIGTTVANRKVHRKFEVTSLFDNLVREGRTPSTEVLSFTQEGNERAAAGLDLPLDTELLTLVRIRSADGLPLALLRNWLPPVEDLTADELRETGLYAALRKRGIKPVVARQSIGARMPTAAERRHLEIRGSKPVLTMTRIAFDAAGKAVEFGDHSYRASDYSVDLMVDER